MLFTIYLISIVISLYSLYRIVFFSNNHEFNWIGLIISVIGSFIPIINFFTSIIFASFVISNTKRWEKIVEFLGSDVKLNKE